MELNHQYLFYDYHFELSCWEYITIQSDLFSARIKDGLINLYPIFLKLTIWFFN